MCQPTGGASFASNLTKFLSTKWAFYNTLDVKYIVPTAQYTAGWMAHPKALTYFIKEAAYASTKN